MNFRDVTVLAPMVRVSALPLRLLALDMGADLVWTEETVAQKIARCDRLWNERLGTVEYYSKHDPCQTRVFQTCEAERGKVVFQVGVGTAEDALAAAQTVIRDIAAFDINMGCPKHFSIHGGMGAALLKKPETVSDIIKTLKRNVNIPITAKIRLLDNEEQTVEFMRRLEMSGVDAITVHCRYTQQRSREPAHQSLLKALVQSVRIPVLGNGDVTTYQEAQRWKEESGCAGIMIARGAVENTSCFRKAGLLPVRKVMDEHIRYCLRYEEPYQHIKYLYQRHWSEIMIHGGPLFLAVTSSKSLAEIADVFDQRDYYESLLKERGPTPSELPWPKNDANVDIKDEANRVRGERDDAEEDQHPAKKRAKTNGDVLGSDGEKPVAIKTFACLECGQVFQSRNALGRHCGETKHRKN